MLEDAIQALRDGKMILISDHSDREDEADLMMAAEFVSTKEINFFIKNGRGLITTPLTAEIAVQLNLPLMIDSHDIDSPAFSISIDLNGKSSGISSHDRATCIKKLTDQNAGPSDFRRPGHVFPLIAHERGLDARRGHTEAAIHLLKLANLYPVAVLCETLDEKGEPLRGQALAEFSKEHQLKHIFITELLS